jgi:hypothetical protein
VRATATHHRTVRKPQRDAQALALRGLARSTAELLAQTRTWNDDQHLAALAEPERPAQQAAVEEFRASLQGLQVAAGAADVSAVKREYARALAAYEQLHAPVGSEN